MSKSKSCFLLLLILVSALSSLGQKEPSTSSELVISFTAFNPWQMVVGSDSPNFALYSDGTVIYLKADPNPHYVSATLNEAEMKEFVSRFPEKELVPLKSDYSIFPNVTDLPTNVLFIRFADGTQKKFSVYGPTEALPKKSSTLPAALCESFEAVLSYRNPHSLDWLPKHIEVMIWPFDYARHQVKWPSKWPDLKDPKTVRHGDMYSLFIDASQLKDIREFLAGLKNTDAVEMNGKKWAISIRFPFPHEAASQESK